MSKLFFGSCGIIFTVVFSFMGPVERSAVAEEGVETEADQYSLGSKSEFSLRDPSRKRSDIFIPLVSMVLPGFDQWWEGQYTYAGVYTGGSLLAGSYASHHLKKSDDEKLDSSDDVNPQNDPYTKNPHVRRFRLGSQTSSTFGGISAYHSFRTSVRSRQQHGEYSFLRKEEGIKDIALAPFNFSYLKRKTTWIPLTVAGALAALTLTRSDESLAEDNLKKSFKAEDALFASATSYNAGLWEEAVFRGWLMPVVREYSGSDFISNFSVATVFALAHLSSTNKVPLPQFILGYYFGYLTQASDWTISESIFVHAWWDVIVLSAAYSYEKVSGNNSPGIFLPPMQLYF